MILRRGPRPSILSSLPSSLLKPQSSCLSLRPSQPPLSFSHIRSLSPAVNRSLPLLIKTDRGSEAEPFECSPTTHEPWISRTALVWVWIYSYKPST